MDKNPDSNTVSHHQQQQREVVVNLNEYKDGPFSDVVFKQLARVNGEINRMNKQSLVAKLSQYNLSTEGDMDILKKRLKTYNLNKALAKTNLFKITHLHPYYVIVDFEATCEAVNPLNYQHEIIEFPAVLVDTEKLTIIDCFQSYCRPVLNPNLSDFCKELTGIKQEQVDEADTFPQVLERFENWLKKHKLGTKNKFAMATDGPWDMGRFLFGQCKISNIPYPNFARKWVNVRRTFSTFYKCQSICLKLMLERLALNFEGRPHCGLDDARNIARVLIRIIQDGASIQLNEHIRLDVANVQNARLVYPMPTHPTKSADRIRRERHIYEHLKQSLSLNDENVVPQVEEEEENAS